MNQELVSRIIAIRKLEREINKNMAIFGSEAKITISDFTRKLAKENPKLLKQIDDLLDEWEQNDCSKKNLPI